MILLFSNNTNQVSLFRYILKPHGLSITHISDRNVIKSILKTNEYLVAFIDLPNPTEEDLLFWKELIETTITPVLLLSSDLTDANRILMRQKASIYLADPIGNFLKYLRIVKERQNEDVIILAPNTIFDIGGHCIRKNDECVELSTIEFKILFLLATNLGIAFTAEELMDQLELSGLSTLYVHIQNLRRKIEVNPRNPMILINYRGRGYTLQVV